MKFNDEFRINPLICCMGWGGGHGGRDGMGGDTGVSGDEGGMAGGSAGGSVSASGDGGNSNSSTSTSTNASFLDKVKDFFSPKNITRAVVDVGSLAFAPTATANVLTKNISGKTIGQIVSEAMFDAEEAGATPEEAQVAGTQAAIDAINSDEVSDADFDDVGGREGAINAFTQMTTSAQQSEGNSDNADEPEYDMTKDPNLFWDTFVGEWFNDENNAKMVFQDHADFMAGEANARNDAAADATNEYTSTLDRLTNTYENPVSFTMGGQTVSFVPRGARNTITSLGGVGESKMNSKINLADSTFENAEIRSPKVGQLTYMDALSKLLDKEKARNQTISDAAHKAKLAATGQQRADQAEPGWSDILGGIVDVGNGLFGKDGWFS